MKFLTYIKSVVILLALVVVVSACQKVVVLDLNTAEPMLVIEGNVTSNPGQPQTVFVSTSGSFYTAEGIEAVGDAKVVLKDENGKSQVLEMYTPGVYFTYQFPVNENITYSIEVTRNGVVYTGSEEFPVKKTIDSLSYVVNEGLFGDGGLNEDGDTTYNIFCTFQDPAETLDYYRFYVFVDDSLVQSGFNSYFVTDDELFNGQLFSLEILGTGAIKGNTVKVEMQSIGHNTFRYYVGLNDLLNGGGMGSTPYNPISNLDNEALGYFGAYVSDTQTILIE
jgi:hypothetical protein